MGIDLWFAPRKNARNTRGIFMIKGKPPFWDSPLGLLIILILIIFMLANGIYGAGSGPGEGYP